MSTASAPVKHVYVHVPFCARRCSYCDFAIAVRRTVPVGEYLEVLDSELSVRYPAGQHEAVETIYFGGGTPSRLGGEGLARAVSLVRERFPVVEDAEITVEANPEDVTSDAVRAWASVGVNRLSLGAQSFHDDVLVWMHRTHGGGTTAAAVAAARAEGITNLSLDLIFALPAALNRNLSSDVERLLAFEPDHVSLYGLTVEQHTPLGRWVERQVTTERNEEGYEEEFLLAHDLLTRAGLEHYEVSNYAKPRRRSRHNSSYWTGAAYAGIGPSAHGFDGRCRRWNLRNYAEWAARLRDGRDPIDGQEELTDANRLAELVYLGLRTDIGLHLEPADHPMIQPWIREGWVTVDHEDVMRCTARGWLRLDALAAALTHHRSR